MAMELKFEKLGYAETKEYAERNEEMMRYIEMYSRNRDLTFEEACQHDIVQTVAFLYKKNGGCI